MFRPISMIAIIWGVAMPVWAVDIPIINAGFEQTVLPCDPASTCFTRDLAAWTGTGEFFTFKAPTGPGGAFPGGIPEGINVAALGSDLGSGSLVQSIGATLQPNTTYTLVFSVGSRSDYPFGGYLVELLAGSTTLASDSSLSPPAGTFVTGRIVYASGANPPLLGQSLGIRLTGPTARAQANFDKISLDATPTASVSGSASQIASGGGWKTTLTLVSLSPTPNSIRVVFRGDDGRGLTLPLLITQQSNSQVATVASLDRALDPGATLLIESEAPAASATLVGWAEVISSGPVAGFAIFRQRGQDGRDSEGTAPLESRRTSGLVLPFDSTAGFATGAALVNPTTDSVIINATVRDDNGAPLGSQAVVLPALGHTSFAVADRFPFSSGRRGIIEFQNAAGGVITGLGLRFSSSGSFTSVPTTVR